jgi:hypothetical protein
MTWLPGQTGNSKRNGARPLGSRNKRTTEAIEAIIAAGHQDPLLTLAELQAKSTDEGIRATAANMLAPFLHSKCGAMPPFRFILEPIELPHLNPTTETEISANIARINQAFASGNLDLDFYNALLAGQHQHINALKAREDIPANMDIQITGGLPSLPGTNITMPQLNGHTVDGKILAPPEPQCEQMFSALPPKDGVIGRPSLWIAEDFGCCASG